MSGKLVILFVFGFALASSVVTIAYQHYRTKEVLELWGSEPAGLISKASLVEALRLIPASGTGDLTWQAQSFAISDQKEVTNAPAFAHVRHALMVNKGFEWGRVSECEPQWNHALRFTEGEKSATVLLSLGDCPRVALVTGERAQTMKSDIASGFLKFFGEQFPQKKAPPAAKADSLK